MLIPPIDLDYKLIAYAEKAQREASVGWDALEKIYKNTIDTVMEKKAKELNRSYVQTPIARDTVLIKRSIFSTSFQVADFPIDISKMGEEDNERARQLRIATAFFWKKSEPFVELNKAMLRMLIFPVGIVSQYWDKNTKNIPVEECNPMDVCLDPDARNADDVQYVTYKYKKTGKEIRHIIMNDKKLKKKFRFYNKVKDHEEFFKTPYNVDLFEPFKRYMLKEIYIKTGRGWLCKTYYPDGNLLLRVTKFAECPFQWGFAREQLSSVVDAKREKQILAYGESEIDYIKEHVAAINKRRNQHSDIVEEQINPSVYLGDDAKANARDLKRGPGSKIPVGDVDQIQERRAPTTMGLQDDMSMLTEDIETTSSVNGLYKAQTSGSDRRATGALALLSAQSSTRIEEQITTANNTLFSHVAKNFVKKVYRYVDDETLRMLGIENPIIGVDHPTAEPFDFTVSVSFGSGAKRQEEYASYMEAVAALGQFQNVNPTVVDTLLQKAMQIKVGDDFSLGDDLFVKTTPEPPQGAPEGMDAQNPTSGVIPGAI